MKEIFIIYTTIIFLFFSYSCKRSTTEILDNDDSTQLIDSVIVDWVKDSTEAFNLALWFEGNLLPSDSMVKYCQNNINYLRFVYSDSFPFLKYIHFKTPWKIGQISVKFDNSTAYLVNQHQYDGWNSLDSSLRPDSILKYPDNLGWALLGFNAPYNPIKLSTFYKNLPGVRCSEPNGIIRAWGTFPIFPGLINGEMTYLFIEDYVWEPRNYYYFKYIDKEPVFIGHYDIYTQEEPDWWEEAKNNIDQFYNWSGS